MAMRTQVLVVGLILTSLLVSTHSVEAAPEDRLSFEMELAFSDQHTLSLDLRIIQGYGFEGQRGYSSLTELRSHDLGNARLNVAGRILAQANDSLQLADQLLRGLQPADPAPLVSSVSGFWVFVYDNGLQVIIDKVSLDPDMEAAFRPLLLFHQYQDLQTDRDVARMKVVLKTPADLTIQTYSPEGTMFPNGQTYLTYERGRFYNTFQNTPVYLDPTEVLGLGNRYAPGQVLKIEPQPVYFQPPAMLAVFLVCLLMSLLLLKIKGKGLLTKKGLPLPLGLSSWVVIALLFPMAFLPFHASIFISCSIFGLLGSMLRLRQARKLELKGGPAALKVRGKRAKQGARQDLGLYRKPGATGSLEPVPGSGGVDLGLGSEAERNQLEALLGGGSGSGAPGELRPLDQSDLTSVSGDLEEAGDFRPPKDGPPSDPTEEARAASAPTAGSEKLRAMDALSAKLAGEGQGQSPANAATPSPSELAPPGDEVSQAAPSSPTSAPEETLRPQPPPVSSPPPIQPSAPAPTGMSGGMAERLARLDTLSSKLGQDPRTPAAASAGQAAPTDALLKEPKTDLNSLLGSPEAEPSTEAEVPQPMLTDLLEEGPSNSGPEPASSPLPERPSPSTAEPPRKPLSPSTRAPSEMPAPEPAPMPELDAPASPAEHKGSDSLSERLAALEALKKKL